MQSHSTSKLRREKGNRMLGNEKKTKKKTIGEKELGLKI